MDLEEEDHRRKAKGAKSRSLGGGLLPVWFTTAFWVPAKPLHLRSMLSKLMRCMKTTMPAAGLGRQKGPNSSPRQRATTQRTSASEVEQIGLWSFASSTIFTWPFANHLPLLQASRQLFARKVLLQPAGGRKCFPRARQIQKHGFLPYRNKQTYFLLAKMCWL